MSKSKQGWHFCIEHLRDPKICAKDSFRRKRIPGTEKLLTFCCPKGSWNEDTERCEVGTKAINLLRPLADKKCKRGKRVRYEWKTEGYPLEGFPCQCGW